MELDSELTDVTAAETRLEILKAIRRGLNVTANAQHIKHLAEAYLLLDDRMAEAPSTGPKRAVTPLVKQ